MGALIRVGRFRYGRRWDTCFSNFFSYVYRGAGGRRPLLIASKPSQRLGEGPLKMTKDTDVGKSILGCYLSGFDSSKKLLVSLFQS